MMPFQSVLVKLFFLAALTDTFLTMIEVYSQYIIPLAHISQVTTQIPLPMTGYRTWPYRDMEWSVFRT